MYLFIDGNLYFAKQILIHSYFNDSVVSLICGVLKRVGEKKNNFGEVSQITAQLVVPFKCFEPPNIIIIIAHTCF